MLMAASETLPPVATANPPMFEDTHAFSTGMVKWERGAYRRLHPSCALRPCVYCISNTAKGMYHDAR